MENEKTSDIVLIHGGSHGAWCWDGVKGELEQLGWRGHALDLPGAGEDPTPRKSVTLENSISAVNDFIRQQDLNDFVLVGHSLAGILLPEVIAANRGKVRKAIYVAAFILDEGERAIDLVSPERRPDYYRLADESSERSLMLPYNVARERFFNDLSEEDAQTAYAKLTPQPLAPYLQPATHGAAEFVSLSSYIICQQDQNLPRSLCTIYAQKLGGQTEVIDAGHDVMLSKPKELAAMLTRV